MDVIISSFWWYVDQLPPNMIQAVLLLILVYGGFAVGMLSITFRK